MLIETSGANNTTRKLANSLEAAVIAILIAIGFLAATALPCRKHSTGTNQKVAEAVVEETLTGQE